jgi:hypothetical protein
MNSERNDYEIRIGGSFEPDWADWFRDAEIHRRGRDTALRIRDADSSAFYGALRVLGDLDCRILSLRLLRKRKGRSSPRKRGSDGAIEEDRMNKASNRGMAALCLAVALMAMAASGAGVFMRGEGGYASGTSVRGESFQYATSGVYKWNAQRVVAEGVGWDIVTLFLAVPAALIAAYFVARGSYRGRLFAVGALAYFAYQFLEYATYWAYGPLFLLYIAIFGTSFAGLAWIIPGLRPGSFDRRVSSRFPAKTMAGICLFMAALLLYMWLSMIIKSMGGAVQGLLLGQSTLVIQAYDLGIIVPLLVLTGIATLRRRPLGYFLCAVMVVKAAMMASAISAMLLSAWAIEGRLEIPPFIIFTGAAVAAIAVGVKMYSNIASVNEEASK